MKATHPASSRDIESCASLFLLDLKEPTENSLVLVIGESSLIDPAADSPPVPGAQRIVHRGNGRVFEIVWNSYVAYSVLNESFAAYSDEPGREGRLFVRFKQSRFLDHVSARNLVRRRHAQDSLAD